ncbi:MAG: hypothetical protein WA160_08295 [Pseudobdellovibrio sp.]
MAFIKIKPYWPFIPYDMYTSVRADSFQLVVVFGTNEQGQNIYVNLKEIFKAHQTGELLNAILLFQETDNNRIRQVLEALLQRYNKSTENKLVSVKMYIETREVINEKTKKYQTSDRRLVGEYP